MIETACYILAAVSYQTYLRLQYSAIQSRVCIHSVQPAVVLDSEQTTGTLKTDRETHIVSRTVLTDHP